MSNSFTAKALASKFLKTRFVFQFFLFLISVSYIIKEVDAFSTPLPQPYADWLQNNNATYENQMFLGPNDEVSIHWKISDDQIHLAIAAEVSGWLAFGIAESGGMPGSDIVIFEAATKTLTDNHALKYEKPILDDCQDWKLVSSVTDSAAPFTLFETTRALNTGDDQDRIIGDDSLIGSPKHLVIAAWGNDSTATYHGNNRLTAQVRLFPSNTGSNSDADVKTIDLKVPDFLIPTDETTYKTFFFSSSDLQSLGFPSDGVAHLIGGSFIPDEETAGLVHHIILQGTGRYGVDDYGYTIAAWTPGPGDEQFETPEDVGIKFGNSVLAFKGIALDFHYNNPKGLTNKVDSSIYRIKYTTNLRKYDGGVMSIGDPFVQLNGEKVGTDFSSWRFPCPSSCTEKYFQDSNVTVFSTSLHMHEIGTRMVSEQIRDGEVINTATVDYYDFRMTGTFQPVHKPYEVRAGDSFLVECIYDSRTHMDRTFGLGSSDEMCIAFLWYYPENPVFHGNCGKFQWDGHCSGEPSKRIIADESELGRSFGLSSKNSCAQIETPSPVQIETPSPTPLNPSATATSGLGAHALFFSMYSVAILPFAYYVML